MRGVAILFVFTAMWTTPVLMRLPKDLAEFRQSSEPAEKVAILGVWIVSLVLLLASILSLRPLLRLF